MVFNRGKQFLAQKISFEKLKPAGISTGWFIVLCVLPGIFIYFRMLNFGFLNPLENLDFAANQPLKLSGLTNIFFGHQNSLSIGNFLPALKDFFTEYNPFLFHLLILLLHLANSCLLYFLIFRISRDKLISGLSAVLLTIHPMNVESVAGTTNPLNLLFSIFALLSCIFYIRFLGGKHKNRYFLLSLLAFLFALFSKSSAVVLPFLLFLIDYRLGEGLKKKQFLLKIPFFFILIIFGVYQLIFGETNILYRQYQFVYNSFDHVFMASYALLFYLFKFFIPVHLSALHPLPLKVSGFMPWIYYTSFAALVLATVFFYLFLKTKKILSVFKVEIIFGLFWFLFSISIFLLSPSSDAIVAEKNSYLPYIGLAYCLSVILRKFCPAGTAVHIQKKLAAALFILVMVFSIISFNRVKTWSNHITVFTDVVKKYPEHPLSYFMLGKAQIVEQAYFDAYFNFTMAITRQENFRDAWYLRGIAQSFMKNYISAISDFDKTIQLDKNFYRAYFNKAVCSEISGDFGTALDAYTLTIKYNPSFWQAFDARGRLYNFLGNYSLASNDLNMAVSLNPVSFQSFNNLGNSCFGLKKYEEAVKNYNKSLAINPEFAEAYYNRAMLKYSQNNKSGALYDFDQAVEIDPGYEDAIFNRGLTQMDLNLYAAALEDFNRLIARNPDSGKTYYYRGLIYLKFNKKDAACSDFKNALERGFTAAQNDFNENCNKKSGNE